MSDGDATVGPAVTLDANGNAIMTYTATAPLNDTLYAVTTSGGQFLVPLTAFIGNAPGTQLTGGTCVVTAAYARSQSLI